MDPIELGPFTLQKPLQSGGMGQVWQAIHRAQNIPVAVKFLPPAKDIKTQHLESRFLEEVQTIARLNHPHIIMVLDYGLVPDDISSQHFAPQSPWLAMELCSGGNLLHADIGSWPQVRRILSEVLRALAYIHARGILHRDLKPANILLTTDADLRPGLKLADFGLAMDLQNQTEDGQTFGTPHYMAPEQAIGQKRIFQPATDLYSFGCLAWALLSGKPPFAAYSKNTKDVLNAQRHINPPELMSRFSIPEGLEGWLLKLMRKAPQDRFRSAADALRNLPSEHAPLEIQAQNPLYPFLSTSHEKEALTYETAPVSDFITHAYTDEIQSEYTLEGSVEILPITQDQHPVSWRDPFYYRPAQKLLGAGLELLALREHQLVGREEEKDLLWRFLLQTIEHPKPRGVVIYGEPGLGKTALINWWSTRAKEVGLANYLPITDKSYENIFQLIGRALFNSLQCHGLSYKDLKRHLEQTLYDGQILSRSERDKLTNYLANPKANLDEKEKAQTAALALSTFSKGDPLFVLLDPYRQTEDLLREVALINKTSFLGPTPLIWVIVPMEQEVPHPETWLSFTLEGLANNEMSSLLDAYLPLHPVLQEKLIHLCAGKPFLLQQYLQQFVEENMLQTTPQGFSLKDQDNFAIMATQENVWNHRLDHLRSNESQNYFALELAATMGNSFEEVFWGRLCEVQNIHYSSQMQSQLIKQGLLQHQEDGVLAFAHPLLRQELLGVAQKLGRLRGWHRLCAQTLEKELGSSPGAQERLLGHWMQAEAWGSALTCLDKLIEKRFAHSRLDGVSTLLRQREFLVETLEIPANHVRHGKTMTYKFELARLQENNAGVVTLAKSLLPQVRKGPWRPLAFHVFSTLGLYRAQKHQLRKAEKYYREALRLSPNDDITEGLMTFHLADISYERGDIEKAKGEYLIAEKILARHQWIKRQGDANYRLGDLAWLDGTPEKAETYWQKALQLYQEENNLRGESLIYNSRGELERMAGNYVMAETHYRKALDLLRPIGASFNINIYKINLGLVLLAQQKFDKSIRTLEEAGHFFHTYDRVYLSQTCKFSVLLCQAALNPKKAQIEKIKDVMNWFPENNAVDKDLLWVCQSVLTLYGHPDLDALKEILSEFSTKYQDLASPAVIPQ